MANHSYNTRNSNEDEKMISKESEFIISSLRSLFDQNFKELRSEMSDLKDVIIKDLIEENKKLRESNNKLKDKMMELESEINEINQYGRRNNLEISGIPEDIRMDKLEEKAIEILGKVNVKVESRDIEGCHRLGKLKKNNTPRKTIIRFVNRKNCLQALINRRMLRTLNTADMGLGNVKLYLNENLTPENNRLAYFCRKLKKDKKISKTFTRNGVVFLTKSDDDEPLKVPNESFLRDLFPEYDFGN